MKKEVPPVKPGAREILEFFRAGGMKLAVASGQQVERGKPEPDIFLLAAQEIGCEPEECCVFEDGANGVRAGMAAGCVTVMVPELVPPAEGLMVSKVCSSLLEAKEQIEAGLL